MSCKEKELLKEAIDVALKTLYEKDKYLITNHNDRIENESHVSERGIVFRFGIYFQNELQKDFSEYNLDAEYNRDICAKKTLPEYPNGSYPDLILHKRGDNRFNLLVMEFKTWWNSDISRDEEKLKAFMDKNGEYNYEYGASVILGKECYDIKLMPCDE